MRTIKFSHHYKKMPAVLSPTFITNVTATHYKYLDPDFIVKDTETDEGEFYPLPKTNLIIIELFTEGHKWQTIRRFTPEKMKYYLSLKGAEVNIQITNEGNI